MNHTELQERVNELLRPLAVEEVILFGSRSRAEWELFQEKRPLFAAEILEKGRRIAQRLAEESVAIGIAAFQFFSFSGFQRFLSNRPLRSRTQRTRRNPLSVK